MAVINAISNEALRMARSSGEVCTRSYEFDRDPAGGPSHPPSRGSRLRSGQGGLAVPVAIIAFTFSQRKIAVGRTRYCHSPAITTDSI